MPLFAVLWKIRRHNPPERPNNRRQLLRHLRFPRLLPPPRRIQETRARHQLRKTLFAQDT